MKVCQENLCKPERFLPQLREWNGICGGLPENRHGSATQYVHYDYIIENGTGKNQFHFCCVIVFF